MLGILEYINDVLRCVLSIVHVNINFGVYDFRPTTFSLVSILLCCLRKLYPQ